MPGIISTRTRRLYQRPPSGPCALNSASPQAIGLVGWWPLNGADLGTVRSEIATSPDLTTSGGPTQTVLTPDGGQALRFASASSQYANSASQTFITGYPLTMACWFNATVQGDHHDLMSIGNAGSSQNFHALRLNENSGVAKVAATTFNASDAETTANWTAGVWEHACGVWVGAADRRAYRNGAQKGTATDSFSPNAYTTFSLGRNSSTGGNGFRYATASLAHCLLWSVALDEGAIWSLYDPATRWELYYPLGRRLYTFPTAGGGGGFVPFPRPRGMRGGMSVLSGGM